MTWESPQARWRIQALVQNLENEAVIQRAKIFTQCQIGQAYGDPRIYGASFSYRH